MDTECEQSTSRCASSSAGSGSSLGANASAERTEVQAPEADLAHFVRHEINLDWWAQMLNIMSVEGVELGALAAADCDTD
eukprot:3574688-Pyramimonas_sp.AAC.1